MVPSRWSLRSLEQIITVDGYIIIAHTDVPSHLYLRWTPKSPWIHKTAELRRGVQFATDVRFCFTLFEDEDQAEAGDTLEHTFTLEPWPVCQTRWFYFHGTVAGIPSPSTSPYFSKHRYQPYFPPPERLAYARRFTSTGSFTNIDMGKGIAQVFWSDTPATLDKAYLFTLDNSDVQTLVSIRNVDAGDLPVQPNLIQDLINLKFGVLAGGSASWPVYKHEIWLPLPIDAGTHYAICALPPTGLIRHWLRFRRLSWNPIYDKDEGSHNYVPRYRRSTDGGLTWAPAGSPSGNMNFECWGSPTP